LYILIFATSVFFCSIARSAPISSSIAVEGAVTNFSFTLGDGSVRIPLAGNIMGKTSGEAAAGSTGATALLTELTPSTGPGLILAAGPPPAGGTVAYPVTTNSHANAFGTATATTQGLIRGTPSGPGGGVINMVTIVGLTPTSTKVTGVAFAAATANANTDPVVLAPLNSDIPAVLAVNLLSNYPNDPTATFGLSAFTSDAPQADSRAHFEVRATTNITELPTLFDLKLDLTGNANGVNVAFSSPLMSSPIASTDFTSGGMGSFVLNPGKAQFLVPFTIPAGTLGTDPDLGSVGLVLNVEQATSTLASVVPEPRILVLLLVGLCIIALLGSREARAGARTLSANSNWAFPSFAVVLAFVFSSASAFAASVTGDTTMGFTARGGTQATYTLFSYSDTGTKQNQNSYDALVGQDDAVRTFQQAKNLVLFDFSSLRSFQKVANSVPEAFSGDRQKPLVQINTKNGSFVPSLSPGNEDKFKLAGIDIVESSTLTNNFKQALGRAVIYTGGVTPQLVPIIGAGGKADQGVGLGAGAAFDPIELTASPNPYPYQVILNTSLQLEDSMDSGGVTFFAVDSRNTDPNKFYADGEPFDKAIWFLHMSVNGPLQSPSDIMDQGRLQIEFHVNDKNILEVVDASGQTISDQAIENAVRHSFSFADGVATLGSYPLFPYQMDSNASAQPGLAGVTRYSVNVDGVMYGQGVNAAVSSVPEPSTWAMLSLGLLVFAYGKAAGRRSQLPAGKNSTSELSARGENSLPTASASFAFMPVLR
jgi:hypothetical protein